MLRAKLRMQCAVTNADTLFDVQGRVYTVSLQLGTGQTLDDEYAYLDHRSKEAGHSRDVLLMQSTARVSEASWKCDLAPNAKGGRFDCTLSFCIAEFGDCEIPFSAKVYAASAARKADSGNGLKGVIADFKATEGGVAKLVREQWLST